MNKEASFRHSHVELVVQNQPAWEQEDAHHENSVIRVRRVYTPLNFQAVPRSSAGWDGHSFAAVVLRPN